MSASVEVTRPHLAKKDIDIGLLRTFVAVSESSTFLAAGHRLSKTQSAVTQQMQRLEQQLGIALFERLGRSKTLSVSGQKLLKQAYALLSLHDEVVRSVQDASPFGHLRIGAPYDVSDSILPLLLTRIAKEIPHVDAQITIDHSPMLMESLHRGEIDMIISTREDKNLDGFVLRESPIVWLCAEQYRHDRRATLPLILADGPSLFAKHALVALEDNQIPWRQAFLSSNLVAIKSAVQAGLGVTARGVESRTSGMRILTQADGLPPLPSITYYLWIRPNSVNPFVRHAFELIKTRLRPTRTRALRGQTRAQSV
ncbi:LysR substrate-binding domain-containing protein [Pandoraea sp. NPDC087047]|uniref:LysR substrate-binding domain-containing protein n=1 Tax=Pandoraea sp. NPDC087047 TaxID=3364390 RepID=UPI0038149B42